MNFYVLEKMSEEHQRCLDEVNKEAWKESSYNEQVTVWHMVWLRCLQIIKHH